MSARAASTRTTASSMVFCGARPSEASVTSAAASRKRRAVIGAAEIELGLRRDGVERGEIDAVGARLVAEHGERGGDLRLGDRRRQIVELGVGDVAQVADRRRAVARQHIERIGEIAAAVLARVGRAGDVVAQAVERQREGRPPAPRIRARARG